MIQWKLGMMEKPSSIHAHSFELEVSGRILVESNENGDVVREVATQIAMRTYAAFAAMCIFALAEALDATSIGVVLPVIARSLNSGTTVTFSLATSFLLASTVFQPIFTSFSGVFGRKLALLVALVLFLLGAVIAGSAKHVYVLLGGRIVQGVGAAGSPLAIVIVTDLVPLRRRPLWVAAINIMWVIGSISGPVIGGVFGGTNWRWIFWINIPIVLISCVGVVLFLDTGDPEKDLLADLYKLDYFGMILFLGCATALLLPLTLAGTLYSWSSWHILLPLILGFVGLGGFICHQKCMATNPVIRLSIFGNRTAVICHTGTFANGILLWMLLYYLPLYYEGVRGYSPLLSGVAALPETLTVAPANIVAAIIINKTGRFRWSIVVGWALTTVGMGLLCILDESSPVVVWVMVNIIPGVGLGIVMPGSGIAVQAATEEKEAGHAVTMFYLLRACGMTVGVAMGDAIFRIRLKKLLRSGDVAPEATVESLLKILRVLRHNGDRNAELIGGIVGALRVVWGVGCAISGVVGIASFGTESYSLDRRVDAD